MHNGTRNAEIITGTLEYDNGDVFRALFDGIKSFICASHFIVGDVLATACLCFNDFLVWWI